MKKNIANQYLDEVKKWDAIRKERDSELIAPVFDGLVMSKESKMKEDINQD